MSPEIPDIIQAAYSPDVFRAAAQIWQQKLADHLQTVINGIGPVLNWQEPDTGISQASLSLSKADQPTETSGLPSTDELLQRFGAVVDLVLRSGQNLHHPHYIGHQVPASVPLAGLFDAIGTITNQVMAIFEMGPWATSVEYALINKLAEKIGWDPARSSGLLTHGGSLANLTALLTARNVAIPDSWERGVPSNAVLVAHADAHYCVTRSAGILGLGSQQVVKVDLDHRRRMNPDHLNRVLTELQRNGKQVIAVSACACATPIGAFDPLEQIADLCERHQVWLHVDAAHGGSALMSRKHRHKLAGIERADSVVWDAHKMLFVPALCAAVLYKNRDHSFETFQQSAPYLFDPSAPGLAEFDSGMRTVECTKRATGFGLWGLWSILGDQIFETMVDRTFMLGQTFHQMLSDADDFEPLHEPECNIVAFRFLPETIRSKSPADIDQFQRTLRAQLIRSGSFYIVQTQLNDQAALRVAIMNPVTTSNDLCQLMEAIRSCAKPGF